MNSTRLAEFLEVKGPLDIERYKGGFSNLTYRVRAGEREWVLRRPPEGSTVKSAHDMGREYRILSKLAPYFAKVPRALAYCDDVTVIGAPFFLMEHVAGTILRSEAPAGVDFRGVSESAIDTLAEIHAVDVEAAGLGERSRAQGYVHRQVAGWTERYVKARTDEVKSVEEVAAWLAAHEPEDAVGCLIHNDYKYDNLVLDERDLTKVRAVLDWEMATIGDPWMDLGTTLGYWVEASDAPQLQALRLGLTSLPGNLTRGEVVQRYCVQSGRAPVGEMVFYYVFGMFKIVGIAQQIYFRYKAGKTTDPRFAGLGQAVAIMGEAALAAARRGTI